ncbi:MAG: ABC transporter permease [Akkermansiaceae bacterium]|jgi:putative ABC transport system permease protein|nr:ABC transporter permease [Akkermansiaceae bacterium]MDP4646544.1 ABC transporter permease [Akkermansiaceae bacterium]MDP4720994.1 ABC transporter permease [Akkermansiaceae bacterium]MDP4781098.1 ABC transporter permease [Akkermansiaceae bacterium]MDP4846459.1 ABC transporter permease [Akkermansiaceae bacterium]
MLPLSYALRNLFRDKSRLIQTVGGSALVVLLIMAATALNGGMAGVLSASGSPRNAILIGTGSEESIQRSEVAAQLGGIAEAGIPGVLSALGTPAASTEIHYMSFLEAKDGTRGQGLFRGVTLRALLVHPEVRLLEGTFPGAGEVMVGRLAWRKLGIAEEKLQVGSVVKLDGSEMRISGIFAAPGTVMESEVWAVLGDLYMLAQRDTASCVVLRMEEAKDFSEVELFSQQRLDLELTALRESDYYSALGAFYRPLRVMTWITAGLVAAGAIFGGFNTLYAAFASRIRELATLQAIGFGRGAVFFSLVQESVIACLAGTLLASVIALVFLDGRTIPFSIGAFTVSISPQVAIAGLGTGILLGVLGAVPPAIRCLKPSLPKALRS